MSQGLTRPNISGGTLNSDTITNGSIVVTAGTIGTIANIGTIPNIPGGTINQAVMFGYNGTSDIAIKTDTPGNLYTIGTQFAGTLNTGTINTGTINSATISGGTLQNLNFGTIAISDGTTKANVMSSGVSNGTATQNAQLIAGGLGEYIGSVTGGTADIIPSLDASNYRWGALQLLNTWVGTVTVQSSNDNNTFITQFAYNINSNSQNGFTNITSNSLYTFPVAGRYLRIRMQAFTSGTAQGYLELFTTPTENVRIITASQGGAWNIGTLGTLGLGTITGNLGTIGTLGTITNLGQVYNAGTLQAGTIQLNPVPTQNILTIGTAGTLGVGTLVGSQGVGTAIYVTSYAIDGDSSALGTAEVILSFGTAVTGTAVLFRATLNSLNSVASHNFGAFPVNAGITNTPLTYLIQSGAGSIAWNVSYFVK